MILTINLYNFHYQIYNDVDDAKGSWGAFCLFRAGNWICQRKTYKLLGRRARRLATASSSLSLWKPINVSTTKLTSTGMLLESTYFSSGHSTDSNSPTDDSDRHSVFRWILSKNQNHQSKTDDTPSRVLLEHLFTKFISIMKKVGQPNFG